MPDIISATIVFTSQWANARSYEVTRKISALWNLIESATPKRNARQTACGSAQALLKYFLTLRSWEKWATLPRRWPPLYWQFHFRIREFPQAVKEREGGRDGEKQRERKRGGERGGMWRRGVEGEGGRERKGARRGRERREGAGSGHQAPHVPCFVTRATYSVHPCTRTCSFAVSIPLLTRSGSMYNSNSDSSGSSGQIELKVLLVSSKLKTKKVCSKHLFCSWFCLYHCEEAVLRVQQSHMHWRASPQRLYGARDKEYTP